MSSTNADTGSVHELVSSYALNALEKWEKAIFEEHLRKGCSACEADLGGFIHVADAIGQSASADAPARTRERLRSALKDSPQLPGVVLQRRGVRLARSEELPWRTLAPGIAYKSLYEDAGRKYNTLLVRMEPGAHYPSHRHSDIEELFLLSGDLYVEARAMHAGDCCRAESGTIHGEIYTNSGCFFLLLVSQVNELPSELDF